MFQARSRVFLAAVAAVLLAGCGGPSSPSAPIEGKWKVFNEQGKGTNQKVTITADHIKWETPRLSPSEGEATFEKKGEEQIVADWYGSQVTFEIVDDKTLMVERNGAKWKLVREGVSEGQ